jgi:hypothetical protein
MPIQEIESKALEGFEGKIVDVELKQGEYTPQYIMKIEPFDKTLIKQGKTGCFWNYIPVSPTSSDTGMAKKSVLNNFINAVYRIDKDSKKFNSVPEFFNYLKGKSYEFSKEALGASFKGHDARDFWLPVKKL